MHSSKHDIIWASLFHMIRGWLNDISMVTNRPAHSGMVVNYDAHASIDDLEPLDHIGIAELEWSDGENDVISISCLVVCSVWDDDSLFRLTKMIGYVKDKLVTDARFELVDPAASGPVKGVMAVQSGTSVMPVVRTGSGRPAQAVAVNLFAIFQ